MAYYEKAFCDWWLVYPRRVGKRAAYNKWSKAIKLIAKEKGISRDAARKWLLDRTMAFANSDKGRSGRFCPHPSTWLHQGRYDDDVQAWHEQSHGTWKPE